MASVRHFHINTQLVWHVRRTPRGVFIGVCDPLGLTLEGDTEQDLRSTIEESLQFFFLNHLEDGTLSQFLSRRGWIIQEPIPSGLRPEDPVRFEVPFKLEPANDA